MQDTEITSSPIKSLSTRKLKNWGQLVELCKSKVMREGTKFLKRKKKDGSVLKS